MELGIHLPHLGEHSGPDSLTRIAEEAGRDPHSLDIGVGGALTINEQPKHGLGNDRFPLEGTWDEVTSEVALP